MQLVTNMVTIIFDDVEGLQEFSKIVYKGANIGKVKKKYLLTKIKKLK